MGMRQFALLVAVVVLVGCGKKPLFDPDNKDHVKIEAAVRKELKKPEGELTKVDLEKVTKLVLFQNQLTDVSALRGLKQLEGLNLNDNQLADVSALAELTQLKTLLLAYNKLTDVSALKGLKQLETLYLNENDLTKAEIDMLKKALPNCEINHTAKN